jgi:hypothetical protein
MARLTHSHDAFLRMMQMSEINMFVFVEGDTDQFFYGLLCQRAYEGIAYRIHTANELTGSAGKRGLIAFFAFLRDAGKLCHIFKNARKASVFCLDKDVDDIIGEKYESRHLVYGELHSVENYLVTYGDVRKALASVLGLDPNVVATHVVGSLTWRRRAAQSWRLWIELCVCNRMHGLDGPCNYSAPSQIHEGPYSPLDANRHNEYRKRLQAAMAVDDETFEERVAGARELVAERIKRDRMDEVFEGQWYGYFVSEDARLAFGKSIDVKSFFRALQLTLDVADEWANTLITQLRMAWDCDIGLTAA